MLCCFLLLFSLRVICFVVFAVLCFLFTIGCCSILCFFIIVDMSVFCIAFLKVLQLRPLFTFLNCIMFDILWASYCFCFFCTCCFWLLYCLLLLLVILICWLVLIRVYFMCLSPYVCCYSYVVFYSANCYVSLFSFLISGYYIFVALICFIVAHIVC